MDGAWYSVDGSEMRPLGDAVQITCMEVDVGDVLLPIEELMTETVEVKLRYVMPDIDELIGPIANVARMMVEHRRLYVSWPRTVRECKARPKGNRGNRRRVYDVLYVREELPVRCVGVT